MKGGKEKGPESLAGSPQIMDIASSDCLHTNGMLYEASHDFGR